MWFWNIFLADFNSEPIHENAGNLEEVHREGADSRGHE